MYTVFYVEKWVRLFMEYLKIYIYPETLILIPTLYFLGLFLYQTPNIPYWLQTWIKLIFAVISCLLYFGMDIRSVVQGILVTGAEIILRETIHHHFTNFYDRSANKKAKEEQNEVNE